MARAAIIEGALLHKHPCDREHVLGFLRWRYSIHPGPVQGTGLAEAIDAPWPETLAVLEDLASENLLADDFRERVASAAEGRAGMQLWTLVDALEPDYLPTELDPKTKLLVRGMVHEQWSAGVVERKDFAGFSAPPAWVYVELAAQDSRQDPFRLARYAAVIDEFAVDRILETALEDKERQRKWQGYSVDDFMAIFQLPDSARADLEWVLTDLVQQGSIEVSGETPRTRYRAAYDSARRRSGPLAILDLLSFPRPNEGTGPSELARKLDTEPNTQHDALKKLVAAELVVNKGGVYHLTQKHPPLPVLTTIAELSTSGPPVTADAVWKLLDTERRGDEPLPVHWAKLAALGRANVLRLVDKAVRHSLVTGPGGMKPTGSVRADTIVQFTRDGWLYLQRCSVCAKPWGTEPLTMMSVLGGEHYEWSSIVHRSCPRRTGFERAAGPVDLDWHDAHDTSRTLAGQMDCAVCHLPFRAVTFRDFAVTDGSARRSSLAGPAETIHRAQGFVHAWQSTRRAGMRPSETADTRVATIVKALDQAQRADLTLSDGVERFKAAVHRLRELTHGPSDRLLTYAYPARDETWPLSNADLQAISARVSRLKREPAEAVFSQGHLVHTRCVTAHR